MKNMQITVRNVDPALKQKVQKLAALKSMSINAFVLDTLRSRVDMKTPEQKITGTITAE
jgi:predicted HicB family RNase H-like nuclease